ncbi:MAG: cytochrome c [Phycisphaerae bacterium]|nr:cytochrome c [Phycisphaerae bacterium]
MIARKAYNLLVRTYPRWGSPAYKAMLATFLVLAIAIPLLLAGIPFVEWLNDMAAQPKGKTQSTFGRTFGEKRLVDRDPPAGAVPRDYYRYEFDYLGNELAEAQWAGKRHANPVPLTVANVQRGRSQFDIYCIVCHGPRGEGNGPVTGANRFPAPPTLHTDQARGYADGTIFHIITKGTPKMPSYRDKLSPEDRWKVIYYVRALQLSMSPGAATQPEGKKGTSLISEIKDVPFALAPLPGPPPKGREEGGGAP